VPKYRIDKTQDGVKVEVDDVQGQQQGELLQAFGDCQEGN
jgi:hypothetical protein